MEQLQHLFSDFSFGLFFMQGFILLLLIFLLKKFAWKGILSAIDEREEGIKNALEAAEKAKKEMSDVNAKSEALLKEAYAERDTLLKDANDLKTQIISEAKTKAKKEGNALIEKAKVAIDLEKKAALNEIKTTVMDLSIDISKKVLKKELENPEKQKELISSLLENTSLQ